MIMVLSRVVPLSELELPPAWPADSRMPKLTDGSVVHRVPIGRCGAGVHVVFVLVTPDDREPRLASPLTIELSLHE